MNKVFLLLSLMITSNAWSDDFSAPIVDGQCAIKVTDALKYFNTLGAKDASVNNQVLYFDDLGVNGTTNQVNAVTNQTGALATIFIKNLHTDSDLVDFIRVSTNLSFIDKQNSKYPTTAIGTTLDPKGAAYASLSLGRQYCGVVSLFGQQFESGYLPVFAKHDGQSELIGALYVGFPVISPADPSSLRTIKHPI
jgi:hypothetical protein